MRIRLESSIPAPPEACFDVSRSIDLHVESMARSRERPVAGVTSGLIALGESVTWEAVHFGRTWRVTSKITAFEPPHRFVDEMVEPGPFKYFRHEHIFESEDQGTLMVDVVDFAVRYRVPLADLVGRWYLRRLLVHRNELIRERAITN